MLATAMITSGGVTSSVQIVPRKRPSGDSAGVCVPASVVRATGALPLDPLRNTCRSYGFFWVLVNVSVPSPAMSTRSVTSQAPEVSGCGVADDEAVASIAYK
jgi:hypothetical protein